MWILVKCPSSDLVLKYDMNISTFSTSMGKSFYINCMKQKYMILSVSFVRGICKKFPNRLSTCILI